MTGRSVLYVPGDNQERLQRASGRGADVVLADLEDAVAPNAKSTARSIVGAWLQEHPAPGSRRWVRLNSFFDDSEELIAADVRAVASADLDAVVLPKFESPRQLERLAALLDEAESASGRKGAPIGVVALVESARGLRAIAAMSEADERLRQFHLGEIDLVADLGLRPGIDESELLGARFEVVTASSALGLAAPLASPAANFHDLELFRISTERLFRLGFGSRAAIHPAQVAVINEVFTPSVEDVRRAKDVIARFETAQAEGQGALVDERGAMVDLAVVRSARAVLARAGEA